jgi:hypothetical protein
MEVHQGHVRAWDGGDSGQDVDAIVDTCRAACPRARVWTSAKATRLVCVRVGDRERWPVRIVRYRCRAVTPSRSGHPDTMGLAADHGVIVSPGRPHIPRRSRRCENRLPFLKIRSRPQERQDQLSKTPNQRLLDLECGRCWVRTKHRPYPHHDRPTRQHPEVHTHYQSAGSDGIHIVPPNIRRRWSTRQYAHAPRAQIELVQVARIGQQIRHRPWQANSDGLPIGSSSDRTRIESF